MPMSTKRQVSGCGGWNSYAVPEIDRFPLRPPGVADGGEDVMYDGGDTPKAVKVILCGLLLYAIVWAVIIIHEARP